MAKKLGKARVVQTGMRISVALRDRLDRAAKHDGLSLNSEMEMRLEASFRAQEDLALLTGLVRTAVDNIARLDKEIAELKNLLDPVKARGEQAEEKKATRDAIAKAGRYSK
jgi:hypothetical protein